MANIINNLNQQDAAAAIEAIIARPAFAAANPHLTAHQLALVRLSPSQYVPSVAYYAPQAPTRVGGYSQMRIGGANGPEYYVHQVAWKALNGAQLLPGQEISHLVPHGINSRRNFNALDLAAESGDLNKSRKFCEMARSVWVADIEANLANGTNFRQAWTLAVQAQWGIFHPACARLHIPVCRFSDH